MDVCVTGRHVEVPEDVRDYAQDKANKLPRFYDRIHGIEVVLGHEGEQFTAEMIVRVDHKHTFVASETGPDTFALIDLIIDKLERQLTKHKEKKRNHKHDSRPDYSE
ncbi:MAG: ribosome-associated translation inhibitor RaiA [Phycisphaerales bacterium]|nr:MAG: ribosome-associated translation inhibitor RaiA [Phycisphaerales bacterium]